MIYRLISLGCMIPLGFLAQGAFAQDRWAGAYAGVAIAGQEATTGLSGSAVHNFKDQSAVLGVFGGYNFVRENGFVWGPDVLLTGFGTNGSASGEGFGNTEMEGSFLLSPRVRAGYATEKALFYGVLGLGISDLAVETAGSTENNVLVTGAIGLGTEFALGQQWSARVEAMHYDLDGLDFEAGGAKTPIKSGVNQITFGISRKF